jgi:hypothetical protein
MTVEQENKKQSKRGTKHDECEHLYLQGYNTIHMLHTKQAADKAYTILVSCLTFSSILQMDVTSSFKKLDEFQQSTHARI